SQNFTLNVTREDMIKAGYSPSVRLFEAAASGVPVISDYWNGIESIFNPDSEILIARTSSQVLEYFMDLDESERKQIAEKARQQVLKNHTAKARAKELETYLLEVLQPDLKMKEN